MKYHDAEKRAFAYAERIHGPKPVGETWTNGKFERTVEDYLRGYANGYHDGEADGHQEGVRDGAVEERWQADESEV